MTALRREKHFFEKYPLDESVNNCQSRDMTTTQNNQNASPATQGQTIETNDLRHGITVFSNDGKTRTVIKIRLNDECRNGREDFAITADVDQKDGRGIFREYMGGCCHEHILKLRPGLAPFVALHLSDKDGAPMHCGSNAFYWFAGFNGGLGQQYHGGSGNSGKSPAECREIFADHIRATDEQIDAIVAANPRTSEELQAVLEDMQFPEQWQREAAAAIAQLEAWTGKRFVSKATKEGFKRLSAETRQTIAERRASGYYEPQQVAARDAAAKAERKAKRIASIHAEHKKAVRKLDDEKAVELALAEHFDDGKANAIYYTHTNTLQFNWSNLDRLTTKQEFDAFVEAVDKSTLPEGLQFKWQANPTR